MSDLSCAAVEALAAELALGILPGDERADALRHLAGCPTCRDRVDGLARIADQMLLAAPEEEPPVGFESRVVSRVTAERQPPVARVYRWRRWATAAVAAAAVVAAALAGYAASNHHRTTPSAAGEVAKVGHGTWTCRVAAFPGRGTQPTELVVRLDEPSGVTDWYTVEAQPAGGGAPVTIGTIQVKAGQGTLAATVPAGTGKVRGIWVLESGQKEVYRASFAPV